LYFIKSNEWIGLKAANVLKMLRISTNDELIFLVVKVKLDVEGFLFDDVIDVAFH
jgi:hypothetical protein